MPDSDFFKKELANAILQASFDGRLKSNEGFLSAVGDLATLTAAAGKDLYLVAAKMIFFPNTIVFQGTTQQAVVKADTVIKEKVKASIIRHTSAASGNMTNTYEFKNLFHKVTPTQVLKIEVITLDTTIDAEGFIEAIEVPTGENPLTYRGA